MWPQAVPGGISISQSTVDYIWLVTPEFDHDRSSDEISLDEEARDVLVLRLPHVPRNPGRGHGGCQNREAAGVTFERAGLRSSFPSKLGYNTAFPASAVEYPYSTGGNSIQVKSTYQ